MAGVKVGDRLSYCWVSDEWYTCTIKNVPSKNNKNQDWFRVVWDDDKTQSQVRITAEGMGLAWKFAKNDDPPVSGSKEHGVAVKAEGSSQGLRDGPAAPEASGGRAVKRERGVSDETKAERGAGVVKKENKLKAEPGGERRKGGVFDERNLAKSEGGGARTTLLDELHRLSQADAEVPLSVLLQAWLQVCAQCRRLINRGVHHKGLTCRAATVNRLDGGERVRVRVVHPQDLPPRGSDEPMPVRHMAPESLQKEIFNEKSDVYSSAVVGWQILSLGDVPWTLAETEASVCRKVIAGERLPRPQGCPDSVWQQLLECWGSPGERPAFAELCERLQKEVDACAAAERGAQLEPAQHMGGGGADRGRRRR